MALGSVEESGKFFGGRFFAQYRSLRPTSSYIAALKIPTASCDEWACTDLAD